jgi:predicted enzyme related to lactoylglutathione lyase
MSKPAVGSIGWIDLTIGDAEGVKDFYCNVVGWEDVSVPVDDYHDFCVGTDPQNAPAAGICHARGSNAALPAQWLIYIVVADLADSLRKCESNGGKILSGPRSEGGGKIAVIQDPAGAVCALYQVDDGSS